MEWKTDYCEPADGGRVHGARIDHRAELSVRGANGSTVLLVQMGSYHVSDDDFRAAVERIRSTLSEGGIGG